MSDLLTSKETARRLCLSIEEVREMLRAGALRGRKIGNRWRINESDLDKPARTTRQRSGKGQGEVANALIKILGGTRRRR